MATHPQLAKLARLLAGDSVELQAAAALVVRELGIKDREVVDALVGLLGSEIKAVQKAALEALAVVGSARNLSALLPFLTTSNDELRRVGATAVNALGLADSAAPLLREKLAQASHWEKRAIEEALAQLGGKDALFALLSGLEPGNLDLARTAVHPLRARLQGGDDKERKLYRAEAVRFLGTKAAASSPAAALAALRVLGFTADKSLVPMLLDWAADKKRAEPTREEALIALRLCLGGAEAKGRSSDAELVRLADKLVLLAESAPLSVARVALLALGGLPVSVAATRRLGELCAHAESERGLLALGFLSANATPESTQALAHLLGHAPDRARAEAAARALATRPEAPDALARALLTAQDDDRATLLASLLRPHARKLDRGLQKKLVAAALENLSEDETAGRAHALFDAARAANPEGTADGLRALYDRLKRGKDPKQPGRILRLLVESSEATAEDAYALASFELAHGQRERALDLFARLHERRFDVTKAFFGDKTLDDQARYTVGFHFAEREHVLGEEILSALAERAGRTKLGKMARAKLKSAGLTAE